MAADRYVRSTDGSDADNGTTWALAKATIAGVAAIDTTADRLFVSQSHAESTATAQTWTFAGTVGLFTRLICGNDGAAPPTAVATTGTVTNTNASGISWTITGNLYCYGLKFTWSSTVFTLGNTSGDELQVYEQCQFIFAGGGSSCNMSDQASSGRKYFRFLDCQFKFDASGEFMTITSSWYIRGGSMQSGTSTPTTGMFNLGASGRASLLVVEDFDFSNCSSSLILMDIAASASSHAIFRNCKMPASWSPSSGLSGTILGNGVRYEMWNCDNGSTNYKMFISEYAGTVTQEIVVVRTGGASDGTTPISWKMVGAAGANHPNNWLVSPEIVAWNDTTGSALTATVEIVTDNVTLTDGQAWLEIHYAGTSGQPIYTTLTDSVADVLATTANQTSSSETWTTTGLTTPVKQKLSVTFTPQVKGPVYARVIMAKASTTVYVDPKLTIA